MSDEQNPKYIFSTTHTDLLVAALNGKIDLQALAAQEMANRGFDQNGNWVGFKKAAEIHGTN